MALSDRDGSPLERAALPDAAWGERRSIAPHGRVLPPTAVGDGPYRLAEEEEPREGFTVTRVPVCARTSDGRTRLWMARRAAVGGGEGSSGVQQDIAEPNASSRSPSSCATH